MIRKFCQALSGWLEVSAAEARTSLSRIEAAKIDEFETELRMLTQSTQERDDLRRAAILVAQLGLASVDLEPMARYYYTHPPRCLGDAFAGTPAEGPKGGVR